MTVHQPGETLRITATIVDSSGAAADPATTVISVRLPGGSLDIDEVGMSRDDEGIYYYDYLIAGMTGAYTIQVKATGGSGLITIEPDTFDVAAI